MAPPRPRLGLQLYTVRDQVAVDLAGTLEQIKAVGYAGVETMGYQGHEPAALRSLLDDVGLDLVSVFVGYHDEDAFARELDRVGEAGGTTAVIPFLPPDRFADRASIAAAADDLRGAAALGAERGITVGYHHHTWEMAMIDGRPGLAWLFDDAHPDLVAEVDVYWAQVAGVDPAGLIESLGPRVRLLHVKDGPATDADQAMVAVGTGSVDVEAVVGAAHHADWHVVELDRCEDDVLQVVEASARFLLQHGWSQGRT